MRQGCKLWVMALLALAPSAWAEVPETSTESGVAKVEGAEATTQAEATEPTETSAEEAEPTEAPAEAEGPEGGGAPMPASFAVEEAGDAGEEARSKPSPKGGEAYKVSVYKDERGATLQVDGKDIMVIGMNWGHMPVGENYTYSLWNQEEGFIKEVLDTEMEMLREMGVNAIRQMPGIPPKWVTYIYETYGIYTVMNHTMGRYGFSVDGVFIPTTNYADERTREVIREDVLASMLEVYKDTPGILMWLLGNENNYGLYWSSFEIEALPKGEQYRARATHLYTSMGRSSTP